MVCRQSKVTTVARKVTARTVIKNNDSDCQIKLTNFHLLLFGVTITTIIMVGKVVASSVSLVSAVRAKLDSCYLQRQISFSISSQSFLHNLPIEFLDHAKPLSTEALKQRASRTSSFVKHNWLPWSLRC